MFELTVLLLVFTFEKVKQNSSRLLPNSNGHFVSLKPKLFPKKLFGLSSTSAHTD